MTDGQTLTHTHQADLSEFENYTGYAFSARSSANSQQAFIDSIASTAQSLASANDLYASVMIAQAIVESGWGTVPWLLLLITIYLESKEAIMANLLRCLLRNM